MAEYSKRLAMLGDKLVRCISSYDDSPVNINDVMSWFSFDAMGEVTFGEDFGMLDSRTSQNALLNQQGGLALLGTFNDAVWVVQAGLKLLPFISPVRRWIEMRNFCIRSMENRMKVSLPFFHPSLHGFIQCDFGISQI